MDKDYYKYVFNKGKFVGNFDEMYRNCNDPWNLDKESQKQIAYDIITCFISYFKRIDNLKNPKIFEIGSGKGYFCDFISSLGKVTGLEISTYAVRIAQTKFPDIQFIIGDIRDANFFSKNKISKESYDFIVMFKGLIWYAIDAFNSVFDNIYSLLKPNSIAIIEINFYKEDYYGKNKISCKDDFINLISTKFDIIQIFDYYSKNNQLYFLECSYFILKKTGNKN